MKPPPVTAAPAPRPSPRIWRRHPSLPWLLVVAVLVAAVTVLVDAARPDSPPASLEPADPQSLLTDARAGDLPPYVGTAVVDMADDTAVLRRAGVPAPITSLAGLPAGSHTVRIWHGTDGRDRIAFVRPHSETDLFRSGAVTWLWRSSDRVAIRDSDPPAAETLWTETATPAALARQLLKASDTTTVSVAGTERLANRNAYGLVLRPTTASRIDYVYLAIDGATRTPLSVQIYARGVGDPVVDVAFTSIRFGAQPESAFEFQPPSDATVREAATAAASVAGTRGSGWDGLLTFQAPPVDAAAASATRFADVRGRWGRGRLLSSSFLTVLVCADGRAYAGPVPPKVLYAAATADRAAATGTRPR